MKNYVPSALEVRPVRREAFVGHAALVNRSGPPVFLYGMFLFGIVLVAVGFVPEVITAKRLITLALTSASVNAA